MSQAWLQDLEERVREASQLLTELRAENRRLQERVDELEEQLASGQEDGNAWSEERDEIRQRVEKLVEHLDGLLAESPAQEDPS